MIPIDRSVRGRLPDHFDQLSVSGDLPSFCSSAVSLPSNSNVLVLAVLAVVVADIAKTKPIIPKLKPSMPNVSIPSGIEARRPTVYSNPKLVLEVPLPRLTAGLPEKDYCRHRGPVFLGEGQTRNGAFDPVGRRSPLAARVS
jgi:hypothetical protein